MSDAAFGLRVRDWLITGLAIYAAMTLAGTARSYMLSWECMRVVTLLLFAALLGLYAFATGPGRRSRRIAYLVAGLVVPVLVFAFMVVGYVLDPPYNIYRITEAMTAGFSVGANPGGRFGFFFWWLGIAAVAAAVGEARRRFGRRTD